MTQNFHLRQKRKPFPLPPTPSHKISTTLQNVSWLFCTQTKPLASHFWNGTNPAASVSRCRQVWTLPSKHLHPLGNAISANAENVYCHADQNKPKGDDTFFLKSFNRHSFRFCFFFFLNGFYPYLVFSYSDYKTKLPAEPQTRAAKHACAFLRSAGRGGSDMTWRGKRHAIDEADSPLGRVRRLPLCTRRGIAALPPTHVTGCVRERVGISKAKCFFGVSLSQSTYVLPSLPSSLPAWRG